MNNVETIMLDRRELDPIIAANCDDAHEENGWTEFFRPPVWEPCGRPVYFILAVNQQPIYNGRWQYRVKVSPIHRYH